MQLVGRGVLDLDKPIEQYLGKPPGDFAPYADLKGDPRTTKLTLRLLLDHTSGFANFRKLRIHFEPGTRYAYSGEGINLAQFVIEKVTGKSLRRRAGSVQIDDPPPQVSPRWSADVSCGS